MTTMTEEFVDAQQMHRHHPGTFEVPSDRRLASISPGDTVKVCNRQERFWVTVSSVDGEHITGVVDNQLMDDYGYNLGDSIQFEKRHIYSIYDS